MTRRELLMMRMKLDRTKPVSGGSSTSRGPAIARGRRLCVSLLMIGVAFAAVSVAPALAAHTSATIDAASTGLVTCGDVAGDRWMFPGAAPVSGDSYVVLAQNVSCSRARSLGAYMALGGAGRKGWKCTRRKRFNGGCRHVVRRRGHRPTVQRVAWYPDIAHPSGSARPRVAVGRI
jgi:hypothetical protein